MIWNDHSKLIGTHAFLGASNYHWINWKDSLVEQRYYNQFATLIGTTIHELASDCIKNRIRLSNDDKHVIELTLYYAGVPRSAYDANSILSNLVPFVNDAISYRMDSEILLYWSMQCYGTADAISFNEKEKMLRIHDLKTGTTPAHIEQLLIYAALFCLEYHKDPNKIGIELRIYQQIQPNFEIMTYIPEPQEVEKIMYLIKDRSALIQKILERDTK